MKKKITKTIIREAIKNKKIELLHKWAKSFNMSFSDFVSSQKCKRKYISDCLFELELIRFRKRYAMPFPNETDLKISAIHHLRNQIDSYKRGFVNYVKVPMYGKTQLYFCSPIYGHKDYNKFSCGLKIDGNEEFINKLIDISKKAIKIKVYE